MPSTAKPLRPLSPHLQVYRPQLTSVMSIVHRATGVGLALGLPVLVAWLAVVASNEQVYDIVAGWFGSPVGLVLLFGWSWAFFYHFCTGIRHLLWDAGFFLDIKNVYRTGWLAFIVSTAVTAYVWLYVLFDWQAGGIIVLEFIGAMIALGIIGVVAMWFLSLFGGSPKKRTSMRTPLAEARGLGSAKEGVEHWWLQRLTAIALIPLSIYAIAAFFTNEVYGDFDNAVAWLSSPFAAVFMIMFLIAGFHHAASGVQVVIEDYVHGEALKLASLITVRLIAWTFGLLGVIAVIKILFFAIITMMMPHAPSQ